MKKFIFNLNQVNGRIGVVLYRDEEDNNPIVSSRSVAPSQWDTAKNELLKTVLLEVVKKL